MAVHLQNIQGPGVGYALDFSDSANRSNPISARELLALFELGAGPGKLVKCGAMDELRTGGETLEDVFVCVVGAGHHPSPQRLFAALLAAPYSPETGPAIERNRGPDSKFLTETVRY